MKVFALMILVVSVYSLEGALVKREADPVPPIPPQLTELFQRIQEYANSAQTYASELVRQEKVDQLRTQAEGYVQTLREQFDPVAVQVRERVNELVSGLVKLAQAYAPKPVQSS